MNPADRIPQIIRAETGSIGTEHGFLRFLYFFHALLHGLKGKFSFQAGNLSQQADFLKAVQNRGFLLWQKSCVLVHDLQRNDQLSNVVQPHAHQKLMFMVCMKQHRPSGFFRLFIEIVDKTPSILHHMPGVAGIVRGSFIDCGRHDAHKGFEQPFDVFNIKDILNRDGRLGSYGFHNGNDFQRKSTNIFICIHGIDQLNHAQALFLPVVHGNHQHRLSVISCHGIVPDWPGKIVLRGSPYIFNADGPVFQITHGADIFPAHFDRWKIWLFAVSSLVGIHGVVAHDLKAQQISVGQIKGSCIAVGQLHNAV